MTLSPRSSPVALVPLLALSTMACATAPTSSIQVPAATPHKVCAGDDAGDGPVTLVRTLWQYHPGGPQIELPEPGYPCGAFRHDGAVRPAVDDERWTMAPDGTSVFFSEPSQVADTGYRQVQFRYFRSLIFVPAGYDPASIEVQARAVDDALHLVLYNSHYPGGFSPDDIGPATAGVGACVGNGNASWAIGPYLRAGEANVVLLVHADLQPTTSSLGQANILNGGTAVPILTCDS